MMLEWKGQVSWFGGPEDFDMGVQEGLALFEPLHLTNPMHRILFLRTMNPRFGLARNLDPNVPYIACRWPYRKIAKTVREAKERLRYSVAIVTNPKNGRVLACRPCDWGPNRDCGEIDLSPGAMRELGLAHDDIATASLMI